MARRALGSDVLSTQHIFGVSIVIECCGFPGFDTVAGLALFSILPPMSLGTVIILLVTTQTGARSVFVFIGLMALRTLHFSVFSLQLKLGRTVIELGIFPVFFVVALSALFAQRPLVLVILLMASIALQWCLAVLFVGHMTLLTSQRLMLAFQ